MSNKVFVKPTPTNILPTIIIDTVQQQQEDNKSILKETTKGNIITGTSVKKIEEGKYILPLSKRGKNKSNDKNNTNNANENNNISAVHNDIEHTLSQPEMGQDFDPYGESLITY